MSLEKLKERIEEDAVKQGKIIESEADKQAKQAISSANQKAEQEKARRLEEAKAQTKRIKSSIIAKANLEAKYMLLETKRKALDKAFGIALQKLNNLQGTAYQEALSKLRKRYSTGKEKSVETKEKGLILIDEDGAQIDLTFKSLIDYYREELEQEVYQILIGQVDR